MTSACSKIHHQVSTNTFPLQNTFSFSFMKSLALMALAILSLSSLLIPWASAVPDFWPGWEDKRGLFSIYFEHIANTPCVGSTFIQSFNTTPADYLKTNCIDIDPFIGSYLVANGWGKWTTVAGGISYMGGNVGIGTATPNYPLDVTGTGRIGYLYIAPQNADKEGWEMVLLKSPLGASAVYLDNTDGIFRVFDDTSTYGNFMVFPTSGNSYVRWNLGVGVPFPTTKLHVSSPASEVAQFDSSMNPTVSLSQVGAIKWYLKWAGENLQLENLAAGNLYFGTNGNWLTFSSWGNLGIGTFAPNEKLSVAWNIETMNGSLTLNSDTDWAWANVNVASNGILHPYFMGLRSRWTLSAPLYPRANDVLSSYIGRDGIDGSSANKYGGAGMYFISAENFDADSKWTNTIFQNTRNGEKLPTETMRITSSGTIGIGTSTPDPDRKLHIVFSNPNSDGKNGKLVIENTANTINATSALQFRTANSNAPQWLQFATNSGNWLQFNSFWYSNYPAYGGYFFNILNNSVTAMVVNKDTGNVGIWTVTPAYKLDVAGPIRSNSLVQGSQFYTYLVSDVGLLGNIQLTWKNPISSTNPNTTNWTLWNMQNYGGSGGLGGVSGLNIYQYSDDNNDWLMCSGDLHCGTRFFVQNDTGNVGIGTDNPLAKLDVTGDARFNGVNVGRGGWNVDSNTVNGYYGLYSNTTGLSNTAIGYQALYSNTSGYWNTALGTSSLVYNTTGFYNTANGDNALAYNTTGARNTAVGASALESNTTGNVNTAIGSDAGSNLTTGSYNIAIGYNAQLPSPTADSQLNIGNWIYGKGGNIGIGTASPGTKLDVNGEISARNGNGDILYMGWDAAGGDFEIGSLTAGTNKLSFYNRSNRAFMDIIANQAIFGWNINVWWQIKISGGTPGIGKVLTSDAVGNATWQNAGGGSSGSALPTGSAGNTLYHNGTDWIASSTLYNNGTTIGIGTTTPDADRKLHIVFSNPNPDGKNGKLVIENTANTINATSALQFRTANSDAPQWLQFATNSSDWLKFNTFGFSNGSAYGGYFFNILNNTVTAMVINKDTGNVGIGTVTPGAKLEVAGQLKITGGSPGLGKVLTSDDSGVASWTTPAWGGAALPGGSAGYTLFHNGSAWVASANIFNKGGNIGIGTSAPGYKLEVAGDVYANGGWLRTSGNAWWYSESHGGWWTMADDNWIQTIGGKNIYQSVGILRTDGTLQVWNAGSTFSATTGWNTYVGNSLGIGVAAPTQKLDVAGNVKISGTLQIAGGTPWAGKVLTSNAAGVASWENPATGGGSTGGRTYADMTPTDIFPTYKGLNHPPYWENFNFTRNIGAKCTSGMVKVYVTDKEASDWPDLGTSYIFWVGYRPINSAQTVYDISTSPDNNSLFIDVWGWMDGGTLNLDNISAGWYDGSNGGWWVQLRAECYDGSYSISWTMCDANPCGRHEDWTFYKEVADYALPSPWAPELVRVIINGGMDSDWNNGGNRIDYLFWPNYPLKYGKNYQVYGGWSNYMWIQVNLNASNKVDVTVTVSDQSPWDGWYFNIDYEVYFGTVPAANNVRQYAAIVPNEADPIRGISYFSEDWCKGQGGTVVDIGADRSALCRVNGGTCSVLPGTPWAWWSTYANWWKNSISPRTCSWHGACPSSCTVDLSMIDFWWQNIDYVPDTKNSCYYTTSDPLCGSDWQLECRQSLDQVGCF